MLDEILNDIPDRMTPSRAARACGRHVSTVWRWINRGVQVNGGRVHLQAVRIGGQSEISASALREFLHEINRRPVDDFMASRQSSVARECEERGL